MHRLVKDIGRSFFFDHQRRKFIITSGMGALGIVFHPIHTLSAKVEEGEYSDVHRMVGLKEQNDPVLPFIPPDFTHDEEVKARVIKDVANYSQLLERVKETIGFKKRIHLAIDDMSVQFHYVPELRERYAYAYQKYCRDITDFIFNRTGIDSFYEDFLIPATEYPQLPENGINVYLIHQLLKKYEVACTFSSESGASVRYKLRGQFFSSHKGAVNLNITSPDEGQYLLKRDKFTIWQNHTDRVFTLFSIPIEETFHYILGKFTDREIRSRLYQQLPSIHTTRSLQRVANHWMAVEEAIVGGLVHIFLIEFAKKYSLPISMREINKNLFHHKKMKQYRFRNSGIKLVHRMGLKSAYELYRDSPSKFLDRLSTQV